MVTALFSNEHVLQSLLNPWEWCLVSSLFPPDFDPESDSNHAWILRAAKEHKHAYRQVSITLRGQGHFSLNGHVYTVSPGTVFLYDAFEEHWCDIPRGSGETDHLRINVFPGRLQVKVWSHRDGLNINPHEKDEIFTDIEAGVLLNDHWTTVKNHTELPSPFIRSRFICALGLVTAAVFDRYAGRGTMDRTEHRREVIEIVQQHISRTLACREDLDELAKRAGYSKFHFAHVFREQTGQSVHEYLNACRIAKTRELIKQGLHQKEIAAALGFASPKSLWMWRRKQRARGYEI